MQRSQLLDLSLILMVKFSLPLTKTQSPHTVPFVPRSVRKVHTGDDESLLGTLPLSPPPSPTFRAGCNLSPSHKEATKDVHWEAWRKKRRKNQYTAPLFNSSYKTTLS